MSVLQSVLQQAGQRRAPWVVTTGFINNVGCFSIVGLLRCPVCCGVICIVATTACHVSRSVSSSLAVARPNQCEVYSTQTVLLLTVARPASCCFLCFVYHRVRRVTKAVSPTVLRRAAQLQQQLSLELRRKQGLFRLEAREVVPGPSESSITTGLCLCCL